MSIVSESDGGHTYWSGWIRKRQIQHLRGIDAVNDITSPPCNVTRSRHLQRDRITHTPFSSCHTKQANDTKFRNSSQTLSEKQCRIVSFSWCNSNYMNVLTIHNWLYSSTDYVAVSIRDLVHCFYDEPNTGWPFSRRHEIPWQFVALLMLRVTHACTTKYRYGRNYTANGKQS